MPVRSHIQQLVAMGPLPDSSADEDRIATYQRLLERVTPPVSDYEARVLVRLFGPDECYGLAWEMLHLVESAPG